MIPQYINVIITILTLAGYTYLFVRQMGVARTKRDNITPLRVILLSIFLIAILTLIPGFAYQFSRLDGGENETLRNVATVTSAANRVATLVLIIVFVNYRIKEEE